ncbi:MAG: hypothetical protein MUC78_11725 [Bacteroidales bacterium]|jgi:hypothetical protein|nr:hypothetical protein [Bacteroidales bacterium]
MKLCEITKIFPDRKTAGPQDRRTRTIHFRSTLTLLLSAIILNIATAQPNPRVARNPAINYDWQPGFVNITELTGGIGLSLTYAPYSKNYFGVTTVNGYQFTRNIKAGIGIGAHFHDAGILVPLYLDARFSFNAQEFVPFFSAAGGAAMSLTELSEQSRIFINPAIGVKWVAAIKRSVTFSTGLMVMSGGGGRSSFINFNLGVEFKGK